MKPEMMKSFAWTVVGLWAVGIVAGLLYSSQQNIPAWIFAAAIPALLLEASLYAATGFAAIRERFAAIGSPFRQGLLLWMVALLPYLVYSIGTGTITFQNLALLALIAGLLAFWYTVATHAPAADLGLLAVIAVVLLSGVFKEIYPELARKAAVSVLGQLMLIRTTVFAVLCIRRLGNVGFGFVPTRDEWRVGLLNFAYFLPLGLALAFALKFAALRTDIVWGKAVPTAIATFLGMLWVVALSEELFFRGMLQPMLSRWLSNRMAGRVATSLLFGMVHLPFGTFPNWKFAMLAAAAGFFYGRAFEETGTIRSGMVTHALVATTWRVFTAS